MKLTHKIGVFCIALISIYLLAEPKNFSASLISTAFAQGMTGGQTVYEENCKACHEGDVAKAPHRDMLFLMSPEMIIKSLISGSMQQQSAHLSSIEMNAVATYLTGTKPGMVSDVTQNFCSADQPWYDYSKKSQSTGWGIDRRNTRYVDAETVGVDKDTIKSMKVKWVFPFPGAVRARSQVAAMGGAIYTGSADGRVYALDNDTGCIRWIYEATSEVRTAIITNDSQNGQENMPVIYFGDVTGTVYALKADSGELIWSDSPSDHPSVTITASPLYHDGRLYIGLSSLEVTSAASPLYECCTFRGSLISYNAQTGEKLWETFTIQEPLLESGKNITGTKLLGPSGAPIWANLALDVKRNVIYAGTGENYSSPANGSSDAIMAFDIDNGDIKWQQQKTANDAWNMGCEMEDRSSCPVEDGPDFDFGAAMMLATTSEGKDLVIAGQKSGMVYAMDPDNGGKSVWERRVGKGGIQGGVHFGMALDGDDLFVPISDFPDRHEWPWKWEEHPGMVALDLNTGEIKWRNLRQDKCNGREFCNAGISAAATTLDGMVVAGAMDGWLEAYDGATGDVIWQYDTARDFTDIAGSKAFGGSFGGAVGPMFHDGMMFVQSGYGLYFHMPGNVLIAFEKE